MKIVYNVYVAVRKLWNAIFGKNGDGSQLVIPGRISGASGDVTVGDGLNLTNNVMKSTVPVVSANPETGESDPELTGLMIGSNKYKVPNGGGVELYNHNVCVDQYSAFPKYFFNFNIITTSSTPLTTSTIKTFLKNLATNNVNNQVGGINGYVKISSDSDEPTLITEVRASSNIDMRVIYSGGVSTTDPSRVSDTVTAL